MRPLRELISPLEARKHIQEACRPVEGTETVALEEAAARVLAIDVRALHHVPPFARAAMDGYAVRSADVAAATPGRPIALRPRAAIHAGDIVRGQLEVGECFQIATGAPLPPGADAVVPVEATAFEDTHVLVHEAVAPQRHVSPQGGDMKQNELVVRAGALLTPARIAVAAAAGLDAVQVWRRPRVAVLSSGSELVPPGRPLLPGKIHDSNGPSLEALFRSMGAEVWRGPNVPDTVDGVEDALRAAASSDLVVVSGGSSAGERDVLRDGVARCGTIIFHGVRVKPGKPLLLGQIGATPVIGLPGYPTSCLSDAYLFVLPALDRLAHRPSPVVRRVAVRIAANVEAQPDRLWFVPVRLDGDLAWPTFKESGHTTSLADADGYVVVAAGGPGLRAGDPVDVTLF